jgi:hypothetical protein
MNALILISLFKSVLQILNLNTIGKKVQKRMAKYMLYHVLKLKRLEPDNMYELLVSSTLLHLNIESGTSSDKLH